MSEYTQITDFSAKDALASGDPEKIATGADIDGELAAIATAIASKANDNAVVHTSGAEAVAGDKTFSGNNTHSGTNTFSGATSFTGALTHQLSDDTAAEGPTFSSKRISASPAVNDNLGTLYFIGRDSAANDTNYAWIRGVIADPTNTAEYGRIEAITTAAGSTGTRLSIQSGVQVGSPTGGDKGTGTLNASSVYDDGDILRGWSLVETQSPSAAASATFSNLTSGTRYRLTYSLSRSAATTLRAQVNADTTANRHGYCGNEVDTTPTSAGVGSPSQTTWIMEHSSAGANQYIEGAVEFEQTQAGGTMVLGQFWSSTVNPATTSILRASGSGVFNGAALSSMVILVSSGTMTGTIRLHKLLQ